MTARGLTVLAGGVCVGLALLLVLRPGDGPDAGTAAASGVDADAGAVARVATMQPIAAATVRRPPGSTAQRDAVLARVAASSLRGTEPDGAVHLDAAGRVIADSDLRRLFDWHLALSGELSIDEIRLLLDTTLRARHDTPVVEDALALFDRYLALLRATADLDRSLAPDAYLAARQRLRREHFGDTAANAMFGDEETARQQTLDRIALLSDPTLDAAERAALAADLDATLSDEERAARELASAAVADEQSRSFDADGTDASTRAARRTELFGTDAAARLATLDAERAAWDARVAAYHRDRAALDADRTLSTAARDAQLAALRERSFAEHEQRRVDALDRIGTHLPGD